MKRILIYGGSSLISIELIKIYFDKNYEFVIFCRSKENFISRIAKLDLDIKKFIIYETNLIDLDKNLKIISELKNSLKGIIWVAGETGNAYEEFENTQLAKRILKLIF